MPSCPEFPAQTLPVLAALYEQPTGWHDGPALARRTGLASGQLRAIMGQLTADGLAQIAPPGTAQPGRAEAERYRLTSEGLASAVIAFAVAAQPAGRRSAC
jgi:hypothetical protein